MSKKALDDYKDVLANIVGKYNKNTMDALYRSHSSAVCP